MAIPLARLATLPPDVVEKLQGLGIETVDKFYELACHKDTRAELAEKTGISDRQLEVWSSQACNVIMMSGMTWA